MRRGLRVMTVGLLLLGAGIAAADSTQTVLSDVQVKGRGSFAEVVLDANQAVPHYSLRTRDGGKVVVIELAGISLPDDFSPKGSTELVRGITASTTEGGIRIDLELRDPASYRARTVDGDVVVSLERLGVDQGASMTLPSTEAAGRPDLRAVRVEKRDDRERVVIELGRPVEFRVVPGSQGPARLELRGASAEGYVLPELVGRDLEVVKGVAVKQLSNRVLVEVDRAAGASSTALREGNRIVWLFAKAEGPAGATRRTKTLVPGEVVEVDSDEVASFVSGLPMQTHAAAGVRAPVRRIDLDFKDADIHNILRLLAEVGGVNIVTSDDVAGAVTIRMRDVPWDQALDVILQAKGLGADKKGNLIRVAPMEVLEKERELAIQRQKQQIELAPLETRLVPVSYATAADVQPRVQEVLSPRGHVSVDDRTNVLIVRDVVDNLDDAEELVRTLDTQTPQVLVEARIVEATSNYTRDVGIQWGGDVSFNQAFGNQTGVVFPSNIGIAGGAYNAQDTPTQGLSPIAAETAVPNFAVNLPAAAGPGAGGALGLTFGSVDGNFNLNVRLSAAESTGSVKIISSPRVLTLDNHAAKIAQGTQIPYSQISAQGVQTAFQTALLQLEVTPHVTADGSVSMQVTVTRNVPDFTRTGANGQPTILKREAQTELLVADGRTAVIGGIYTRNSGRTVDQVPLLGSIPILGVLFQRRRTLDERNELLIFLTPRIVNRERALMSSK